MEKGKLRFDIRYLYRLLFYFAGQFILAFGVAFAINADLGISPVSSPARAINIAFAAHGMNVSLGTCVTGVYFVYVLVQIVLLRREFKLYNLFQLAVSTVFGWFVDLTRLILGGFTIPTFMGQLVMLAISIVLIALGILMYIDAKVLPMPSEGMGLTITAKLKKYPYHNVKIVIDCCFVTIALLIMLIFTGGLTYTAPGSDHPTYVVYIGTVVTALTVGKVMGLFGKVLKPIMQRICFAPSTPAEVAAEDHLTEAEQTQEAL